MGRLRIALLVPWVILAAAGACASPPEPAADRRTVDVGGRPWTVILAGPDGMRGAADFGGADGMLFDAGGDTAPGAVGFVMDRVAIPLDIAWFAADGRLVGTATMVPCPVPPCPVTRAPAPYRWAIEAPPGAFGDLPDDARLDVSP